MFRCGLVGGGTVRRWCQTAPAVYRTVHPMWAFELLVSILHPTHFCFHIIKAITRTAWTCFTLAVSRRLLTATVQVPTHFMSYRICDGYGGTDAGFFRVHFGFPCHFSFRRMLHTNLSFGTDIISPQMAEMNLVLYHPTN
jgi:hypothetical protein